MNNEKLLKKYIKEYVNKGLFNQKLREQILEESNEIYKKRVMEEMERNLDLFLLEDNDWEKFPIGMYYESFFGEDV